MRQFTFALCLLAAVSITNRQVTADYSSTILADSPIGYWRLDDTDIAFGAIDASGNGRDLVYDLFLDEDLGQPGAIFQDPGTSVQIIPTPGGNAGSGNPSTHPSIFAQNDVDFSFDVEESFSIEYWVKIAPDNQSSGSPGIITKGYSTTANVRPWYLSRFQNGSVDFFLRDESNTNSVIIGATPVNDDLWHHVVGVYDGFLAETHLYIDGSLQGTVTDVPPAAYGDVPEVFTIGNHLNRAFDGSVDEVAVYDQALTGSQVVSHFEAGDTPPPPSANLNIDFGSSAGQGGGPGGRQAGFLKFDATEEAGNPPVTMSFNTLLGEADNVDITVSGYSSFRNYAALEFEAAIASPLASDMVLRSANGTLSVTLDGLLPGDYEITTIHHSSQFGDGTFDIQLSDAAGANQSIATGLIVSAGTEPAPITTATFGIKSDGSPVTIDFTGGTLFNHLSLNGFLLDQATPTLNTEPVLSVDINDRGNSEFDDPTVTENGFREFIIGGFENDEVDFETTQDYGDMSVTITPTPGNTIGDRRRDQPTNGPFFDEQEILRDFIFARGDTELDGLDVLIEGLDADTEFEVTLWMFDDGSGNDRNADWFANGELVVDDYTFNGNDVPPSPLFNGEFNVSFLATTDEFGNLLLEARADPVSVSTPDVFLNAFQISRILEAVDLSGDINGDGTVDKLDFDMVAGGYGSTHGLSDLMLVQANFGATAEGSPAAVPEPATIWLLVLGGFSLLLARLRGRK